MTPTSPDLAPADVLVLRPWHPLSLLLVLALWLSTLGNLPLWRAMWALTDAHSLRTWLGLMGFALIVLSATTVLLSLLVWPIWRKPVGVVLFMVAAANSYFMITYGVVMMLLLYIFFSWVLKNTAWGRHVYAVGDDPAAASLAGIRVGRVLFSVYLVGGIVLAIAGWIAIGRVGSASPTILPDANLESITAVVIGGTSLFGGRGTMFGTLIGAILVGVVSNGLVLAGLDQAYKVLAIGILVIVSVALDQWIRKVRS